MRSFVPAGSSVRAPVGRRQLRVCAEHTVTLRFNIKQRLEFGASMSPSMTADDDPLRPPRLARPGKPLYKPTYLCIYSPTHLFDVDLRIFVL